MSKQPTPAQILNAFVTIGKGEVGVKEIIKNGHGTNRGPRVDEYQRADTLPGEGYAWCGSYNAWKIKQTEARCSVDIPYSFSASCDVILADGKKRSLMHNTPQVGDIFLVMAKLKNGQYSKTDAIHTGSVEELLGGGFFLGNEGNTNADGGREGVGVMRHKRPVGPRITFMRWIDGLKLPDVVKPVPSVQSAWTAILHRGKSTKTFNVTAYDNRPVIATRDFADFFDIAVDWDAVDQQAHLNHVEVPIQVRLVNGRSYYPVRVLGDTVGFKTNADSAKRIVEVYAK